MERRTKQGEAILRVLEEEGRPLTVEEILRHGRLHVPSLGVTTVYRSIRAMVRDRVLVGVQYPGQPIRYEVPAPSEHIHFLCNSCRKVHDLPLNQKDLSLPIPSGFVAEGHELIVYGICADCSKRSSKGR